MWVRYRRMSGLSMQRLSAAGPYGFREIGPKSLTRAPKLFGQSWFLRSRLTDRLPLLCSPSCPHLVGTIADACRDAPCS